MKKGTFVYYKGPDFTGKPIFTIAEKRFSRFPPLYVSLVLCCFDFACHFDGLLDKKLTVKRLRIVNTDHLSICRVLARI